jgi:hypothetical protein
MADVITGNTELLSTKQSLILSLVQKELKFAAKLFPTITDLSAYAGKGTKSFTVPNLSSFTVVNRVSGAQGDSSVLTAGSDLMNLDYNAYVAWIIDSFDEIQSNINVQMENASRAASALGRYVDTQVIAKLDSIAGYNQGAATTVTADILLDLREYLLNSHANPQELTVLMGTDQEKAMLKIADFVRADYYGQSNIGSGIIGKVYGMNVMVHSGLAASKVYCYDKSGIAGAFQQQPSMSEQGANEFGSGAKRVAVDQIFGICGLQIAQNGAAAGKSPLVSMM